MPLSLEALALVAGLVDGGRRLARARALARHFNAEELIVFIMDSQAGMLLPAPGFPGTLPDGRAWRAFIQQCCDQGSYSATLPVPESGSKKPAVGAAATDGSVLVLLGGAPTNEDLACLTALLPILAAAFRGEHVAVTAAAQARLARDAETQATTLAGALETARRQLQLSLREAQQARQRANFLAEASALLADPLAYRTALPAIAALAVPFVADYAAIYLLKGQQVELVALSGGEAQAQAPEGDIFVAEYGLLAAALRSEQAQVLSPSNQPPAELWPNDDVFSVIARRRGLTVAMGVAITSRSRVLGALLLACQPGRLCEASDLSVIDELARRVGQALDNVQLYVEARHLNAQLEERVRERTAELEAANLALEAEVVERKTAQAKLDQFNQQLQDLSARLQAAREEEQTRIAREIHDVLGQELTALRMAVARLQRNADTVDAAGHGEMTRDMLKMIDSSIQTVRRLAMDLRPAVLDDFGLVQALDWQLGQFEKQMGVRARFETTLEAVSVDSASATALFRITQEALTNVARHAQASEVAVRLAEAAGELRIEIHDNGQGMAPQDTLGRTSLGLVGMRERIRQLGGRLAIRSAPGQGTNVIVTLPLADKAVERTLAASKDRRSVSGAQAAAG